MTVGIGSGIAYSNVNVANPNSATATLSVPAGALPGFTSMTVATSAGTSNSRSFWIFPTIDSISLGESKPGMLATTDGKDPNYTISYADIYQLTIPSSTTVTINLSSTAFTSRVYLLSSDGTVLATHAGGPYAQVATAVNAGTYYIVASSYLGGVTGNYMLSVTGTGTEKRVRGQVTSQ
jgi:hypothetical protein